MNPTLHQAHLKISLLRAEGHKANQSVSQPVVTLQKESNSVTTDETPVNVYIHKIQSPDMRFFAFTLESIRMLLKAAPSITLFMMSPGQSKGLVRFC
ncbi:Leucine-rich repeat and WD repeat-containing protein [Dirofilaria immitis]